MSYGFKFTNNNNQVIIDDTNVKPWIFSGSYVGYNYETTDVSSQFNRITAQEFFHSYEDRVNTTWRVYEAKYVAPNNANCFVAFKLPDTQSQDVWYSPQKGGPKVNTASNALRDIPGLGNAYPIVSIYILIAVDRLQTMSEAQVISLLPIPYFFAADTISSLGTGYGVQVFKANSQCVFDSNKKHIKLDNYSYGYLQVRDLLNFMGPYLPGTAESNSYTISGSTGSNLAFVLSEGITKYYSSQGTMYETRIWYQKNGNILKNINQNAESFSVSNLAEGYVNLIPGTYYNVGTETTTASNFFTYGGQSNNNVLVNQLFQRVLILDVTGFDVPYTPTEFPAGYVLTGNWPAEPNGDNYEYQNLIDKFYTEITLTTFNVPNGTQVPYTITGTGITADDFQNFFDQYRPNQTVSTPLNSYITINANSGKLSITLKDDSTVEGNETFTLALNNGKASISVTIKERKSYSLEITSGTLPNGSVNEGSTITFRLTTKNVANGTVIPWSAQRLNDTIAFDINDVTNPTLTGNFTISTVGTTGTATGTLTLRNDNVGEGPETFTIGAFEGTTVLAYVAAEINDTSAPVSYSLRNGTQTGGAIFANEGDTFTFTIVGQYVPNQTRVYPAFSNSTFEVNDFIIPTNWYDPQLGLTGVVMNNNVATFSFTVKNDKKTEGMEYGNIKVFSTPDNTRTDNILTEWPALFYITDTSLDIVHTITAYVTAANEGQYIQFDMNVAEYTGTNIYWRITGIDSSDLDQIYLYEPDGEGGSYPVAKGTALTGSFIFDTTLAKTMTIGIRNDVALEGTETLGFTLRRDSIDGATVASKSITINDTSYPTYSMSNDTESNAVTEGATIRWNIATTGVPSYSYLYWTNIGTTDGADFNDAYGNINYGSVLIVNNSGWFERTLRNDLSTEGTENIIMQLRTGGNGNDGILRVTDTTITVSDTSRNLSATIYPTVSAVNEPGTAYFVVDSPNIPDGQLIYWSNIGSAEAADFNDNTNQGSVSLSEGTVTFGRTTVADSSTEGAQTIQIRIYLDPARTNILATSTVVTINDTSKTPRNEIVSVSPSSVVYPSGMRFQISGGTPNGTYSYSVNNQNYDTTYPLDAAGATDSGAGAAAVGFNPGSYTVYVYFPDTGNYRQASWTVTAPPPTYSFARDQSIVNETTNRLITFTITTTNVADGTQIYWINYGSTDLNDFTAFTNQGFVTVYNNTATFNRNMRMDGTTEGDETVFVFFYSDSGYNNLIGYAGSTTVTDTSTAPVYNEAVSVSPSTAVYPNGVTFYITGATPSGSYRFSVNNTNYDSSTYYLDASGNVTGPTNGAGAGLNPGTYTIYVYFVDTGHTRQTGAFTITAANPVAGTLLSQFCNNYTRYGTYADGSGGTYNAVIEYNAAYCGYVAPSGPVLSNFILDTNDAGNIDTWGSPSAAYDGLRCKGTGRNNIDMFLSRTFTLNQAATITATLKVGSEEFYDFGEMYFDGVMYARGSGIYDSGPISGPISAGTHTVKVRYTKDGSASTGTDTAFVEYSIT